MRWHDGEAWQLEIVDKAPGIDDDYQSMPSLAAGRYGSVHIAYLDSTNTRLNYAFRDALGWHSYQVDAANPGTNLGYDVALALDSLDQPHIAYSKAGRLTYVNLAGTAWQIQDCRYRRLVRMAHLAGNG